MKLLCDSPVLSQDFHARKGKSPRQHASQKRKQIYLAHAPIAFKSSYAPCNLFTVANSAERIHALGS